MKTWDILLVAAAALVVLGLSLCAHEAQLPQNPETYCQELCDLHPSGPECLEKCR